MAKKIQSLQSPSDIAQTWLLRGRHISIEGIQLLPRENMFYPRTPLFIVRGQAQAFYLDDMAGRVWILKKFLPGRTPDAQYIKAIQSLIPLHPGFEAGYQRRVLSWASVTGSALPAAEFASWVENTILMPQVEGSDWAYVADRVREGQISLTPEQRLLMCRNLSEKVRVLESSNLSHRDLSSMNIFIDTNSWNVHLIDWDSIYHPNLTIPLNTTCGTDGYVAPFIKVNGTQDPRVTWACHADRFSMAVLNVEFLTVERNSPVTGDGGLLNQDEIFLRGGRGIDKIADSLRQNFPSALGLFERTLQADNFEQCPGPDEWIKLGAGVTAPSLKEVYDPKLDFQKFIHALQKPPDPVRPAPRLNNIEQVDLSAQALPVAADKAHPAPNLSDMKPFDPAAFISGLKTTGAAPPAPGLGEMNDPAGAIIPPPAGGESRAAPCLDDVEDPFAGVNKNGGSDGA